jgi:hypothetical protein
LDNIFVDIPGILMEINPEIPKDNLRDNPNTRTEGFKKSMAL